MAVYTQVGAVDIAAFLTQYDIGSVVALKPIAEGIENSNYYLETTTGRYILTLFEKRVKPEELPFFLALEKHLKSNGFPCPEPVAGRDGDALRSLCGKKACVTTFLNGKSVTVIRPDHCYELGRGMAEMHLAAAGFKMSRDNDLSVAGWRTLADRIGNRADEIETGLAAEIQAVTAQAERDFPTDLPRGVIHADLFPDNVFFENDKFAGVIDYYFACSDAFAYELAICLNAWCFDQKTFAYDVEKARAMFDGYLSRRTLDARERSAFPLLAKGAALRFLLTRTFDWLNRVSGALVTPKNPMEYVAKLRFHQGMKTFADYGLK